MKEAMKAVHEGKMSIDRAAVEYGMPPTTLKDRLSGRVRHDTKPGPRPYLSPEEEEELALFVVNCSKMGYGKTRMQVLQMVEEMTVKKHVSDVWFKRFKSHFLMSLHKGDAYTSVRADCTNCETFAKYF